MFKIPCEKLRFWIANRPELKAFGQWQGRKKQLGKLEGAQAVHLISTMQDFFGWAAALLTLLAFSCDNIVRLRYVALTANVAFLAYGFSAEVWPVFFLHAALVPVNVWRLRQALHQSPTHLPESPVCALASASVKADTHA